MNRIAIIGGGAAGCFAAANISYSEDRNVILFEKTGKLMQKVKASGGGRCNVTHACFDIPELLGYYPRGKALLRKSLYQFTPQNTIDWFEQHNVQLKTEADGRIFPVTDDAQTIINCIEMQMAVNKVATVYHKSVSSVTPVNGKFEINFSDDTTYLADKLLIATGGFPKPDQYKWLAALGHTIQSPVPSLFTFNMRGHRLNELMGISQPIVTLKIQGSKITEQGPVLITHWGLSGPVVLKTSAWAARELNDCQYNFKALINWLHDKTDDDVKDIILHMRKKNGKQLVVYKNPFNLPRRLWEYMLVECQVNSHIKWGDLPAAAQQQLTAMLLRDTYHIQGKTTYKEEFVTCGGINISEINAQTMESKLLPGLYFAGEILDVDGVTGGFNFQHAWSSGYIAARNIIY